MNDATKEDLVRLQVKVNMLFKALFSYYAEVRDYNQAFDDMKDAIIDDVIDLLGYDHALTDSFADMYSYVPFSSEREWWEKGLVALLKHSEESVRYKGLFALRSRSSVHDKLPPAIAQCLRDLVLDGTETEVLECIGIFANGYLVGQESDSYQEELLFDEGVVQALAERADRKIQRAFLEAVIGLMESGHSRRFASRSIPNEFAQSLVLFGNSPDDEIVSLLIAVLRSISVDVELDMTSLLESENDQLRYHALCMYIGYDPGKNRWTPTRHEVDAKLLGPMMTDAFPAIARLATRFLQERLGSGRRIRR